MRNFIALLFAFIILFAGCQSTSGNTTEVRGEQVDLHTMWPFMVGAAVSGRAFNPSSDQYELFRHFEVLVAENEMKPDAILPRDGVGAYRWEGADRLVNYAEANNKKVRGHVLIWHSQTPAWFFKGSGKEGRATKDELYTRMENHIKAVFEKYGGRVEWWDVVNEVLADGGGPRDNSEYTKIMIDAGLSGMNRFEYVLKSFQWARQYADANGGQNVKMYINDYNVENNGAKQSDYSRLVDWLIENDAPIDGVGLQCHIKWDHPTVGQLANTIDRFAGKTRKDGVNMMVQITELDISVFSTSETYGGVFVAKLTKPVLESRLVRQTQKYKQLFDMCKEKFEEGKLDMVLVWGLADADSWLNYHPRRGREDHPLLFDYDYEPKSAYWALVNSD